MHNRKDYEAHLSYVVKRTNKYINVEKDAATKAELIESLTSWLKELDYTPPAKVLN